jgi:acyl phosphate:glycerol-3-phosphate acyltransferase
VIENMNISLILLASITGYLLGAIPVSRVFSRLYKTTEELDSIEVPIPGSDETYKVTSTGAAAASMKMGPRIGCTIGLLDILKVLLPTLAFRLFFPNDYYFLIAAIAGMVGHNWPVFHGFKGGRGISAAYGGLIVVDFFGAIISATLGLLFGLFVLRDFIIAYMAGLWFAIPWLWFTTRDPVYLAYILIINILFVLAMIPDLKQYVRARRSGNVDLSVVMGMTPMGRGMQKMMDRLGLSKKQK